MVTESNGDRARRVRRAATLGLLSALLFIPNVVLLLHARDTEFAIGVFLQSLLLWTLVVCSLGRWRLLVWVSLPLLLVVPLEAFFVYTYGYPTTRHVVALLYDTTARETLEYLSGLWGWLAASLAIVVLAWALLLRVEDRRLVGRRVQLAAIAGLALVSVGHDVLRSIEQVPLSVRQYTWANAFPGGIAFRVAGFAKAQWQGSAARAAISGYRWNARTSADRIDLILVIGESARPDHWGIDGYARDTTPMLSERTGVVFLPDLVTPWTLTRYSVPAILARKRPTDTAVLPEKSIIAAFREAGFETHWFANQDGLDEVSLHAAEAEFRKGYNFSTGRGDIDAQFDGAMLADVESALARPAPRKLLVIHTKGSHWEYQLRYPPEFRQFVPDHAQAGGSGKYDAANRDALVNAYDNSIRYTDWFLDSLIGMLARRDAPSALVYVSDHGQGLYDAGCDIFGHGNDLEAAFRTAGLVWLSPAFTQDRPDAHKSLVTNARSPLLTTLTIFNTVADIGGLNIADPERSLIRPQLNSQPRMVNTHRGLVDFDRAGREGVCRLVAPRPHQ